MSIENTSAGDGLLCGHEIMRLLLELDDRDLPIDKTVSKLARRAAKVSIPSPVGVNCMVVSCARKKKLDHERRKHRSYFLFFNTRAVSVWNPLRLVYSIVLGARDGTRREIIT